MMCGILDPGNGSHYYRLKMVDLGDSYGYSYVRTVSFNHAGNIMVYPNPTDDKITVGGIQKGQQLRITSPDGTIWIQKTTETNKETIDVSRLATGVYILQVYQEDGSISSLLFTRR